MDGNYKNEDEEKGDLENYGANNFILNKMNSLDSKTRTVNNEMRNKDEEKLYYHSSNISNIMYNNYRNLNNDLLKRSDKFNKLVDSNYNSIFHNRSADNHSVNQNDHEHINTSNIYNNMNIYNNGYIYNKKSAAKNDSMSNNNLVRNYYDGLYPFLNNYKEEECSMNYSNVQEYSEQYKMNNNINIDSSSLCENNTSFQCSNINKNKIRILPFQIQRKIKLIKIIVII